VASVRNFGQTAFAVKKIAAQTDCLKNRPEATGLIFWDVWRGPHRFGGMLASTSNRIDAANGPEMEMSEL
jgi:hypothetical protein